MRTAVRDSLTLVLLLIAAAVLVYVIPPFLNRFLFLLFLYFFFQSRKNYLWIAFLLILILQPGGLYSGGARADQMRLPIYTIMPGVSMMFEQLFCIVAFIKAYRLKGRMRDPLLFMGNLKLLGFYLFYLILLSIALDGSYYALKNPTIIIVNLSFLYSAAILLKEENDYISFFKLVFPFAFVSFALQLYDIYFHHQLVSVFKPVVTSVQGDLGNFEDQRPIEMSELILFTFFGSIYFINQRKRDFSTVYLVLVNFISFASIFMSASRTWVVSFTCAYLLFVIMAPQKSIKIILKYSHILVLAVILLFSVSLLDIQYHSSMKRISTFKLFMEGDLTAGGSVIRYTVRSPLVLQAFRKSTIMFGAAFSKLYLMHNDQHVGYHNLIFNAGIIGIWLFGYLFFKLLHFPFIMENRLSPDNPYKSQIKLFPIFFVILLILNGSTQFIGYDVPFCRVLTFTIMLLFLNNQILKAVEYHKIAQPEESI